MVLRRHSYTVSNDCCPPLGTQYTTILAPHSETLGLILSVCQIQRLIPMVRALIYISPLNQFLLTSDDADSPVTIEYNVVGSPALVFKDNFFHKFNLKVK